MGLSKKGPLLGRLQYVRYTTDLDDDSFVSKSWCDAHHAHVMCAVDELFNTMVHTLQKTTMMYCKLLLWSEVLHMNTPYNKQDAAY